MNMSEIDTVGDVSDIHWHHLETSLEEHSRFKESVRTVMSLLHFMKFYRGSLATVLANVDGLSA